MRIFSFEYGDEVRITRTNLRGTVLRVGGGNAVIQIRDSYKTALSFPLSRLRHLDSFGVIALRQGRKKLNELKNKIKHYVN
jgi:hypothetical protein